MVETAPNAPKTSQEALALCLWLTTTVDSQDDADVVAVMVNGFLNILGWEVVEKDSA